MSSDIGAMKDNNAAATGAISRPKRRDSGKQWLVPAGLVVLSLVPVVAGAVRLAQLAGGAEITPANARFFASPIPVVLHIISVSIFAILGAFQFVPRLRRGRRSWHRIAGWAALPSGFVAALSGLWMTLFYPWPADDGVLLYGERLVFGSWMLMSLLLGLLAARRRDFSQHGVWMLRAYAIGMGAGTQVLTHVPWTIMYGAPGEFPRAILMGAGWVINLVLAEWIIRSYFRRAKRPRLEVA